VNGYLVETGGGVISIEATLTELESTRLRKELVRYGVRPPGGAGAAPRPNEGVRQTLVARRRLRRRCVVSEKTVAQKARIKPGTTIAVINRVPGVVESLGLPEDVSFVKQVEAKLVFLFVRTRDELEERMPPVVAALGTASAVWVFFRKGSTGAGLDMNRNTVWAVAEKLSLRPLGLVGIDDTWSAFRLRRASSVRSVRSRLPMPLAEGAGPRHHEYEPEIGSRRVRVPDVATERRAER
jgi:hypothetical protein